MITRPAEERVTEVDNRVEHVLETFQRLSEEFPASWCQDFASGVRQFRHEPGNPLDFLNAFKQRIDRCEDYWRNRNSDVRRSITALRTKIEELWVVRRKIDIEVIRSIAVLMQARALGFLRETGESDGPIKKLATAIQVVNRIVDRIIISIESRHRGKTLSGLTLVEIRQCLPVDGADLNSRNLFQVLEGLSRFVRTMGDPDRDALRDNIKIIRSLEGHDLTAATEFITGVSERLMALKNLR